jgi:CDP-paratose 2-epimerase
VIASLITGGAGFIGTNLADRLAASGESVVLYDNLSRQSVGRNVAWLQSRHGERVRLVVGDVRDGAALALAAAGIDRVFHFAAQVAVTTSFLAPLEDLDVNARGTLTLLEALRAQRRPPSLVFTSTSKVYGALSDLELIEQPTRWQPRDSYLSAHGLSEARPLDFHSPYGCSKGAAESYVLDYARSFGLRAVVFRMSSVYGPHQFGTEDQGWVAHFWRCAHRHRTITSFGDGRQVRDVLHVGDLVDALLLAHDRIGQLSGSAFNIGGGVLNTLSLVELINCIEEHLGYRPPVAFADWRPGDPRYYVSDTRRFGDATGWRARTDLADGMHELGDWLARLDDDAPLAEASA